MSEVIPEDEDRGGDGAIAGAIGGSGAEDGVTAVGTANENEGGTGADDGGSGSQTLYP